MRFDLHIHSSYSGDSKATPKEIIREAEKKGLQGLGIMDHNTLEGYFKAKKIDTDLIIVPGLEVSTKTGHVMALGVKEEIPPGLDISRTIKKIRDQGGLAVAVHPTRFWSGMGEKNLKAHEWDAIEVQNGRSWKAKNRKAEKIAEKRNKPVVGGSDAHRLKTVGKAYTILDGVDDWRDVVEKVKSGDVSTGGNSRTLTQTFFYVRRALSGWILRGFKRI